MLTLNVWEVLTVMIKQSVEFFHLVFNNIEREITFND